MSGGNFTNNSANASFGRKQTNDMLSGILHSNQQEQQDRSPSQAVDPETASVASYSSTAALLKSKFRSKPKAEPKPKTEAKTATPIDTKKIQEQALKSQVRFSV
ncbi:hypothetical protein AK830_g10147 [Neonectria ditissima]|uniref:Uncharacterized protein n=1 Tax=Neonectria ditissima TaxID=78410 RepID=A0A0P7B482_9HYPO|nr:hypothetical protein AK830_g10147 [Neonectria ditissima]